MKLKHTVFVTWNNKAPLKRVGNLSKKNKKELNLHKTGTSVLSCHFKWLKCILLLSDAGKVTPAQTFI